MAGIALTAVLVAGGNAAALAETTYTNPVYGRDAPDPYVLRVGDTYYAYTTNAGSQIARSLDRRTGTFWPPAFVV